MRPVNLIPPERRRGDRAAARTGVVPYVLLAGVALAVVAVSLLAVTGKQVDDRTVAVSNLEAEVAATEAQAQALAPYAEFAELETVRTATVTGLAQSRFDWERVMRELALVLPEDVYLTSLAAAATPGAEAAEAVAGGIVGPALTITGCADGHEAVAGFVGALEDLDGVTRVGIDSSQKAASAGDSGDGGEEAEEDDGGGCSGGLAETATFSATVAFDSAPVIVPTDPAASAGAATAPVDSSGVEEAQAATDAADNSAKDQSEKASKAANLVPGVAR